MIEPKDAAPNLPSADSPSHEKFGAQPTAEPDATLDPSTPSSSGAGPSTGEPKSIGPYRLFKKLGEGGMGIVWLAEQTAPVRRHVALKLIRAGFYDDSVLQRFQSEQQSLAVMNHPAIAKVFDAGSTPVGQPYFVMEYVDGPAITRYCDSKRLKIRDRLELFIKVCEGVQHAHQKAIIHRDLKPSNVLVTEVDGKPVPRIIDFGIAKAISSESGIEQTQFTEMGALIGTRGFMSPEQTDPNVLDVDTRTDVYSLGALLYVLLTGMLPFDSASGKKKPLDEVLRQLREEDPPSPSTKISTEKDTATAAAERRGTETRLLAKLLRGDLDWITMKAVERDRARRYGTPSELAADIERYLDNRPVLARPASPGYRLKKYVQRHRLGVAAFSGAVALLVAFAITEAVQLRRTTRERDRANRITDFMINMFKQTDPSQARGNTVTAREILDQASSEINSGLTSDPELQAQIMYVMTVVYDDLGLSERAETLANRVVEVRRRALGTKNPDTLEAESILGWELFRTGRYVDAEKQLRVALAESRSDLGVVHRTTLGIMRALSATLNEEGRDPDAENLARETLDLHHQVFAPESPETINAMDNLAAILHREHHLPEAEKLYRQTLDVHLRHLGPEHPITLLSTTNLADVLADEEHLPEAEQLYRRALETDRRILGPNHPHTSDVMNNLANVLSDEHKYDEAEQLNQEALDIRRRLLGPDHPVTASSTYNLACLAALKGQPDKALSLLSYAIDHGLSPQLDLGIPTDSDLQSLHSDRRFTAVVAHAKERAAGHIQPQ